MIASARGDWGSPGRRTGRPVRASSLGTSIKDKGWWGRDRSSGMISPVPDHVGQVPRLLHRSGRAWLRQLPAVTPLGLKTRLGPLIKSRAWGVFDHRHPAPGCLAEPPTCATGSGGSPGGQRPTARLGSCRASVPGPPLSADRRRLQGHAFGALAGTASAMLRPQTARRQAADPAQHPRSARSRRRPPGMRMKRRQRWRSSSPPRGPPSRLPAREHRIRWRTCVTFLTRTAGCHCQARRSPSSWQATWKWPQPDSTRTPRKTNAGPGGVNHVGPHEPPKGRTHLPYRGGHGGAVDAVEQRRALLRQAQP
jgi:hypothetical protein